MARRRPPQAADVEEGPDLLPPHLRGRHYPTGDEVTFWVDANEEVPADFGFPAWFWHNHQAGLRKRAAQEAWCAERGYSWCRTFLGRPAPSRDEVAAGLTGSPPGGPFWSRRSA